jgi:ArsR family transcriptional regulator
MATTKSTPSRAAASAPTDKLPFKRSKHPHLSITTGGRTLVPVFKALADETRVRIVWLLADAHGEVCVCDIEAYVKDLSQSTISHHLKILRDAGVVTSERRGTWVYYALDITFVKSMSAWAAWIAAKQEG